MEEDKDDQTNTFIITSLRPNNLELAPRPKRTPRPVIMPLLVNTSPLARLHQAASISWNILWWWSWGGDGNEINNKTTTTEIKTAREISFLAECVSVVKFDINADGNSTSSPNDGRHPCGHHGAW
jgi:hypothetical protein